MTTKLKVLNYFNKHAHRYISGESLAKELGISRTAIWYAVSALRKDGYIIDSKTNLGYRFEGGDPPFTQESLTSYFSETANGSKLFFYESLPSTNTLAKSLALEGASDGTVVIALEQTSGRGRLGRSFYSPKKTGLYLSIILKPEINAEDALFLTIAASVKIAESIEDILEKSPQIKWVNDLYFNQRKVCGILTEASANLENGCVEYVVIGVGINLGPDDSFPKSLETVAGSLCSEVPADHTKYALTISLFENLSSLSQPLERKKIIAAYKKRSLVIGQSVRLINGQNESMGTVLDIDEKGQLVFQPDGSNKAVTISSGEISLRLI